MPNKTHFIILPLADFGFLIKKYMRMAAIKKDIASSRKRISTNLATKNPIGGGAGMQYNLFFFIDFVVTTYNYI